MKYQDTIINGFTISKGIRNCSDRYEMIKPFCNTLGREFSVCDIGANMCYFGLRLINDFGCTVMAFEFNDFEKREKIILQNKTNKLMFVKRKIKINDLRILRSFCHFDLILAMSVLHHIPDDTAEFINELRLMSNNVIIEMAQDDSTRSSIRKNYTVPSDAILIGNAKSHLSKSIHRPIFLLKNN